MLRDPLPLSLDPLEDESLPGYLLRLSHRLEHTPARVMFLTGLTVTDRSEARPRLSSMVHLDADTAAVFSTAARLTPSETAALCLSAFEERYPYAAPAFAGKARTMDGRKVIRTERWLFTTSTRYCPQCLASNGSTIQNEHGGAWRRSWRLPPVFACMRHRVFLEHLCPVCQQPVHFAPGSGARLLPRIKDHRLHPLQCRTTLPTLERPFDPPTCGTRLDTTAGIQGPPPAHEQLVLQERLAALLRPDGPGTAQSLGEPIPPEQYFTQIRWLTSLLSLTWPAGSDLVFSATSRDAIDTTVAERHRRMDAAHARKQEFKAHDAPPLESRACAGFLEAAVRITDQHSPAEAIDLLRPVLLSMGDLGWKTVWGRRYLLDQPPIQQRLRLTLDPLILIKPTSLTRRQTIAHRRKYGPEHIPAALPQEWFDRHFRHLDLTGISPRVFRRAICVRLYQEATGQPASSAPKFFGHHRPHHAPGAATALGRWQRNTDIPELFDAALAGLTAELEAAKHLVNYQRRRARMRKWQLSDADWQAISRCLPEPPVRGRGILTASEQPAASTFVWCLVTQGERHFAPWVVQGGQMDQIHEVLKNFRYAKPHRRHRPLLDILTALAVRLADAVDADKFKASSLNVHELLPLGGTQ